MLYPNNSVFPLTAIGHGVNALYCLTNLTTCCTSEQRGVAGDWLLPADSAAYTISRVASAVLLNRITEGGPTGIFTCQIPNGSGQLMMVYAGVDTGVCIAMYYHVACLYYSFVHSYPCHHSADI